MQGNLDPVAPFAPLPELKMKIAELLKRTGTRFLFDPCAGPPLAHRPSINYLQPARINLSAIVSRSASLL